MAVISLVATIVSSSITRTCIREERQVKANPSFLVEQGEGEARIASRFELFGIKIGMQRGECEKYLSEKGLVVEKSILNGVEVTGAYGADIKDLHEAFDSMIVAYGEDGNVAHVVLSKEVGAVGEEETKVNLERFIDNAIQKIEFRTGLKREVGKDDSLFQWVSYRPSLLFGAVYENVNGESCVAMVSMVDINRSL